MEDKPKHVGGEGPFILIYEKRHSSVVVWCSGHWPWQQRDLSFGIRLTLPAYLWPRTICEWTLAHISHVRQFVWQCLGLVGTINLSPSLLHSFFRSSFCCVLASQVLHLYEWVRGRTCLRRSFSTDPAQLSNRAWTEVGLKRGHLTPWYLVLFHILFL